MIATEVNPNPNLDRPTWERRSGEPPLELVGQVGVVHERTPEPTYEQILAEELVTYRVALERIARFRNVPVPASVPALIAAAALEGRT